MVVNIFKCGRFCLGETPKLVFSLQMKHNPQSHSVTMYIQSFSNTAWMDVQNFGKISRPSTYVGGLQSRDPVAVYHAEDDLDFCQQAADRSLTDCGSPLIKMHQRWVKLSTVQIHFFPELKWALSTFAVTTPECCMVKLLQPYRDRRPKEMFHISTEYISHEKSQHYLHTVMKCWLYHTELCEMWLKTAQSTPKHPLKCAHHILFVWIFGFEPYLLNPTSRAWNLPLRLPCHCLRKLPQELWRLCTPSFFISIKAV